MTFQMTIKTAQEVAAEQAAGVTALAKKECERRILAVVSRNTQMNLAHVKDSFSGADATSYAAGMAWIGAMRDAWKTMAAEGKDPLDDASWPLPPAGLVEWLEDY